MSEPSFETLLKSKKNTSPNKWYPCPVSSYKNNLLIDRTIENSNALGSNLAYNLQYIEFLEKSISELDLSNVIYIMHCKTYVITAMSILEGIFTNLIKSNGIWKTSNLTSIGSTKSNEKDFNGSSYVIQTELLVPCDEYELQMNLDDLIKKLKNKRDILDVDHLIYPALNRLKDLRNRIHLQKNETPYDHDYNAFDFLVKKEMGAILYDILSSKKVSKNDAIYKFLLINKAD